MIDRQRIVRAGIKAVTAVLPGKQRIAARHALRARYDNHRNLAADWLVLSRPKSGRTWLRVLLSRLYQQRHQLDEHQLLEFDNFHRQNAAIPVVAMTHGRYLDQLARHPRHGAVLRAKPVVFLVRDPRDVAVSDYFQVMRRAKAHKRELHGVTEPVPIFDFLMESPLGLPAICEYMNHWQEELSRWERVYRLAYERLRAAPAAELTQLCAFLREEFTPEAIAEAVAFADFESLKRKERADFFKNTKLRGRNEGDPDSFKVRRGKVGGYRDYFTAEEVEKIDRLVAEQLHPDFGYR